MAQTFQLIGIGFAVWGHPGKTNVGNQQKQSGAIRRARACGIARGTVGTTGMTAFFLTAVLFAFALVLLGKFGRMAVRKATSRVAAACLTAAFSLLVLGAWVFATSGATVEDRMLVPLILPSPAEVLAAFPRLHLEQGLARGVLISFGRIASGFALAAIAAVPLGVLMASYPKVAAFFKPLSVASGYVPIVVFIPLSLAWFGVGEAQKVGFLFIGCFVALLPAVIRSVADVPDDYINLATTKGATQWQVVTRVLVPVAGPAIWDSLRMVYGVGWGWIILAEIVNGDRGVGYLISISERRGQTASIYAIILVIVLVAVVCDQAWLRVGRWLFPHVARKEIK
jgi:NitT/TauT family transport system permease protein